MKNAEVNARAATDGGRGGRGGASRVSVLILSRGRLERLRGCLRSVLAQTFGDREILVLRQFKDLSYREIAHALELPEGTVIGRI